MANGKAPENGQQPQMNAQVVGQFIPRPFVRKSQCHPACLTVPATTRIFKIEVNVNAEHVREDLFQSAIDFKAHATNKDGTIYIMECVYGGLFKLQNVPEQALEPFLLINCPTILFPFLRRLVADITREGGFPPLLLDPIDFGGLYMRRQQEMANAQQGKPS